MPKLRVDPAFAFLIVFSGFLFLYGLGDRDLLSSHEARAAQNAQVILDDGHWRREEELVAVSSYPLLWINELRRSGHLVEHDAACIRLLRPDSRRFVGNHE